jgi:hypothetical protein
VQRHDAAYPGVIAFMETIIFLVNTTFELLDISVDVTTEISEGTAVSLRFVVILFFFFFE